MTNKANNNSETILFIKGSLISFIGVIILGIINYLIRRTLALNLSSEEFGFFYSTYSFINMFLVFIDIGMGYSLTILISKYIALNHPERVSPIFNAVFIIKLILSILLTTVLIFSSKNLLEIYFKFPKGENAFIILCFLCIPSTLSGIIIAICNGLKDFFFASLMWNIINVVILVIVISFTKRINVYAPACGFLIGNSLAYLIGSFYLKKRYNIYISIRNINKLKSAFSEVFGIGKWITFGMAGITAIYYMDTIMLTWFTNLQEVALYNIALPIMQIFQSFVILPIVFIPIASGLWAKKDKEQIAIITNGFITLMIFFSWGIFIFTVIMGKDIITILFSSKYIDASNALVILCTGIGFYSVAQFFIGLLNCMGKAKISAFIILVGLICNILFKLLLIPYLGIEGAAISTAISYIIIATTGYLFIKKEIKNFSLNKKAFILGLFSGIICTITILLVVFINWSLSYKILFTIVIELIFIAITLPVTLPIIKNLIVSYKKLK